MAPRTPRSRKVVLTALSAAPGPTCNGFSAQGNDKPCQRCGQPKGAHVAAAPPDPMLALFDAVKTPAVSGMQTLVPPLLPALSSLTTSPPTPKCDACAEPLHSQNMSTLPGGIVVHVGCAGAPAPTAAPAPASTSTLPGRLAGVYTNIKGGGRIALGACTAIVGPNRSKKTAWLDAIRLALRGKHEVGSSNTALLSLADGSELLAGVTDDAGQPIAAFQLGETGQPARQFAGWLAALKPEDLDRILPLVSIDELLRFGTPLAREEFLRRFGTTVSLDVPAGLDERQTKAWHEALMATGAETASTSTIDAYTGKPAAGSVTAYRPVEHVDTIAVLTELPSHFRSRKLGLGKQISALQQEIDRRRKVVEESVGVAVTEEIVEAARLTLTSAEAWERLTSSRQRVDDLRAEHATVFAEASKLSQAPLAPPELPGAIPVDPESDAHLRAAVTEAERCVQLATGQIGARQLAVEARRMLVSTQGQVGHVCLFCTSVPTADLRGLLASAETQLTEAQEMLHAWQAAATKARRALADHESDCDRRVAATTQDYNLRKSTYDAELRRRSGIVDRLNAIVQQVSELEAAVAQAGAATDPNSSAPDAKKRYDALVKARTELKALDENAARIRQLETEQGLIKTLEKVASTSLASASKAVAKTAEDTVRPYLPKGFETQLVLVDESGKGTYRWDVKGADGQLHRKGAMCGAELGVLKVALACAWAEGLPVKIVLLDDSDLAGFSPENVRLFLTRMAELVAEGKLSQVICAWSRANEIPDGYTIIRAGVAE